MPNLFDPITIGALDLPNRIFMSPLTRGRAGVERLPNKLMAKYYAQRASAGLIFSEATSVTPMGVGYPDTPGIWSEAQVEGWKYTTDAVHKKGGKILLQLWHVGRISHPHYLNDRLPVAPSAIQPKGHVSLMRPITDYVTPRALELDEIPRIVEEFKRGAENARRAGFDGVEIHGANGYLLDQFLQDSANKREDKYGGAIENRARFALEVTDAVLSAWTPSRVGYHISPRGDAQSMGDSDLLGTFSYLMRELKKRNLAFVCSREYIGAGRIGPQLKKEFGGVYIANEKFDLESAQQVLTRGEADAVCFGKLFLANPDLPERFAKGAALNPPDSSTFYVGNAKGYTDYPSLKKKAS